MLLASLVEPAFGLIFWMTLSFGIGFFLLAKVAWKPILKALHEREQSIDDAIGEAKKAREEVAEMARWSAWGWIYPRQRTASCAAMA